MKTAFWSLVSWLCIIAGTIGGGLFWVELINNYPETSAGLLKLALCIVGFFVGLSSSNNVFVALVVAIVVAIATLFGPPTTRNHINDLIGFLIFVGCGGYIANIVVKAVQRLKS